MEDFSSKRAKHVIVISYDAFSEDNWDFASSLPNLSLLISKGVYSNDLISIYPSLTYVVHSTLVTGVYPDRHEIVHNNPFQPFISEKNQEWFWYRKDINATTIYDAAKEANLTTSAILWPVTGKAKIDYNLPEVVAINGENQAFKILKNGSPFFCAKLSLKYGKVLDGVNQPNLDDFSTLCAVDTIKSKKPNLLLLHLIDLDDTKHNFGTKGTEVNNAMLRMDKRLGSIIKAVDEAGIKKDTAFIVIGDHGHIDIQYKVHLNNILKEMGLIYEDRKTMKWRAYFQCNGGSAYLHIKKDDQEAERLTLNKIKEILSVGKYGIEDLYNRTDLDKLHIHKSIKYMVEAKRGYCFDESISNTTIEDLESQRKKYSTHGYRENKDNYKCNLLISGEMIKNNTSLENLAMVDVAPTIARLLGISFPNCDGKPIEI